LLDDHTETVPSEEVEMSLSGKRALITGSSRGIGRGIALKLAEQGTRVAVHYYQNEAAAQDTLAQVRERGADGLVVQADVLRGDEFGRMFEQVHTEFGGLDIFVSNARPELPAFFSGPMDITPEQWDAAFNSQAKAFVFGARAAAQAMPDGGRIIAVTYATGSRTGGLQPWVAMGSAKAAMESAVRYVAVALAKRGITVNSVSPSWTEDSVLNTLPEPAQDLIRGWHQRGWTPMGRLATPADVGNAVALLCSEEASFITGQLIMVDGGASLMNAEVPPEIQLG
jgi:NAD(P)-dependent dehydrogenase (short-subunit alcohol dehydrogenase family)